MNRSWPYPLVAGMVALLVSVSGDLVATGEVSWTLDVAIAFALALAVDRQFRTAGRAG
ncbi:hypothetical protein EGH21_06405 [Halomicroarcula sp. F13]|uniref:Uncharacterized protein n=1 Tax=Haloarcula rubra TaxID=2487747 RepID=A0AAW4PM57_9EURY|nr:hypothetical protein [Halomicroarcula rubra]MBX0322658.1 hypothetical protein [Halomicroarcula rubra]